MQVGRVSVTRNTVRKILGDWKEALFGWWVSRGRAASPQLCVEEKQQLLSSGGFCPAQDLAAVAHISQGKGQISWEELLPLSLCCDGGPCTGVPVPLSVSLYHDASRNWVQLVASKGPT